VRLVVVTGASRGLGLAVAGTLAAEDFSVLAVARRPSPALEAEMERRPSLRFLPFDLAEVERLPELARTIREAHGPVYGLVNNAGTATPGLLATMPAHEIGRMIQLNTLSPIVLTKHLVRGMMAAGSGRVVNVSSIVAATGYNALSVYAATKAAMVGFTRSLAREVGRVGVTVNAVAPGFVETELTGGMAPEELARIAGRSALRRLAGPQDVADAVAYLMSDRARNVTGTVLTVDAGNTA
jgi:3-oxoacyl-[acyl-carrier protein] reductase